MHGVAVLRPLLASRLLLLPLFRIFFRASLCWIGNRQKVESKRNSCVIGCFSVGRSRVAAR